MTRWIFEFEDGQRVTYDADTLAEAMALRYADHGDRSWTIVFTHEETVWR